MARHTELLDMKYIIEKAAQILVGLKYKRFKFDEIENSLHDEGHSIVYTALIMRLITRQLKRCK